MAARTRFASACRSIGKSRRTRAPAIGRCSSRRAAVRNRSARSAVAAASKQDSKRVSRRARSGPASGTRSRLPLATPASRSSCSVAARARGKPGARRHRLEVAQRGIASGIECRPRRHRLRAEPRSWREAVARQFHDRRARRELRQAEAMQAEGGRPGCGNGTRQVVCRAARRADDRGRMIWGTLAEKRRRSVHSHGGRRRFDNAEGTCIAHRSTCPGAMPGIRNGSTTRPCRDDDITSGYGLRAPRYGLQAPALVSGLRASNSGFVVRVGLSRPATTTAVVASGFSRKGCWLRAFIGPVVRSPEPGAVTARSVSPV